MIKLINEIAEKIYFLNNLEDIVNKLIKRLKEFEELKKELEELESNKEIGVWEKINQIREKAEELEEVSFWINQHRREASTFLRGDTIDWIKEWDWLKDKEKE